MKLESEIIRPGEKGSRQDEQGIKRKLLKEDKRKRDGEMSCFDMVESEVTTACRDKDVR